MPKKRTTKKRIKKSNKPTSLAKELKEEFEQSEKWIIQRKKFLIKLGWVAGIIIILLFISHIYLRVHGFA